MNDVTSLWKNNKASKTKSQSNIFTYRPIKSPFTSFLIKLAAFVLKRNDFFYNDTLWLQISRTSVGTKMTPSFACLLVGHLEDFIRPPKKSFSTIHHVLETVHRWCIFILEGISLHSIGVCTIFKWTLCFVLLLIIVVKKWTFFDIIVTKKDKYLSTSLYSKPTY